MTLSTSFQSPFAMMDSYEAVCHFKRNRGSRVKIHVQVNARVNTQSKNLINPHVQTFCYEMTD